VKDGKRRDNLAGGDVAENSLGGMIKRQRLMKGLTLRELSELSGVSVSHLGRVERGERFPAARILRKIAGPLGIREEELFIFAEYLPPPATAAVDREMYAGKIDPYVAGILAQEPVELQRAIIGMVTILKSIARCEQHQNDPKQQHQL
jgi:transcriptional regulator with XRE-family HTH domain